MADIDGRPGIGHDSQRFAVTFRLDRQFRRLRCALPHSAEIIERGLGLVLPRDQAEKQRCFDAFSALAKGVNRLP